MRGLCFKSSCSITSNSINQSTARYFYLLLPVPCKIARSRCHNKSPPTIKLSFIIKVPFVGAIFSRSFTLPYFANRQVKTHSLKPPLRKQTTASVPTIAWQLATDR